VEIFGIRKLDSLGYKMAAKTTSTSGFLFTLVFYSLTLIISKNVPGTFFEKYWVQAKKLKKLFK